MKEYTPFQRFKDVSFETDKDLTKKHYSEKGGHKARHDAEVIKKKLNKIKTPEVIIFRDPPTK
jgi:hypothetical protein